MENVGHVVQENDAWPFDDLDDACLHHIIAWELQQPPPSAFPYEGCLELDTLTQVKICDRYYRTYDVAVDSTFNVVKAAIMRKERLKKRGKLQLKDLSVLLTMPLEITFTVFGHLHPIDLYHLGMVSRSVRAIVYSTTGHWELAWEASGIPRYPKGWTYRQWTNLLFGPAICDKCSKFVALPDYAHLKRYCTKCFSSDFVWDYFVDDSSLASLIPGTIRSYGWDVSVNRFRDPEDYGARNKNLLRLMRDKIKELQAQIKESSAGNELLARFIKTKQEEVQQHMEHARQCDEWALDIFNVFSQEIVEFHLRALQKLKKSMKKDGFIEQDFSGWEDHIHGVWATYELLDLTKTSWKRCLPSFIRSAQNDRSYRLLDERVAREAQRRDGLLAAYTEYRHGLSPMEWWRIPSPPGVLQLPACLILVDEPSEKVYESHEFTHFIESLVGEFLDWQEDRKVKLVSSLPSKFSATSLPPDSQLELALAVFSCPGCARKSSAPVLEQVGAAMFGWDEAKHHLPCSHLQVMDNYIGFDPAGSDVVLSLLEFLELPETATIRELDDLNQRFLCGQCTLSWSSNMYGLHAMTWRECVLHVLDSRMNGSSHNFLGWHLLTSRLYEHVMRREQRDTRPMDNAWYCMHCKAHASDPVLRHVAIDHVRLVHNIKRVDHSVDIMYLPIEKRKSRKPLFIPVIPNGHSCKLCPLLKEKMLVDRPSIELHVRNQHKIEPNENDHWEVIPPILRSSEGVVPYQITLVGPSEEPELPETVDALSALLGVFRDDEDNI